MQSGHRTTLTGHGHNIPNIDIDAAGKHIVSIGIDRRIKVKVLLLHTKKALSHACLFLVFIDIKSVSSRMEVRKC